MPDVKMLERFLRQVDRSFPVPLSRKQELGAYARKLCEKATLCACCEGDEIISLVAGYTDDLPEDKAYMAVAATLPHARGRGLARKLVQEFIAICREKRIRAVHLYAVPSNAPAMKLYRSLGFRDYVIPDEPRPEDAHLILYMEEQGS